MIFAFGWKSTYQNKILKFNVSFALHAAKKGAKKLVSSDLAKKTEFECSN
jgi:hypothetical protein